MQGSEDSQARAGEPELKISPGDVPAHDSHASGAKPPTVGTRPSDEAPSGPIAERRGATVSIRCRTVDEAYLVAEELEEVDIIAILPSKAELVQEQSRKGYVEVTVSAAAYDSARELQAAVEYRHGTVRSDQPLLYSAKALALLLGIMIVPGALIFAWLSEGHKSNGYHRRAKELKLWFIMGVLSWVLIIAGCWLFEWLNGPTSSTHH